MEENQRNQMSERMSSERNDESLNTSSTSMGQEREGSEQGSGRSYDYGSGNPHEGGDRQNMTANQGGVNDLKNRGGNTRESRSTGEGSGLNTKRSVTGSDYDGQNSE